MGRSPLDIYTYVCICVWPHVHTHNAHSHMYTALLMWSQLGITWEELLPPDDTAKRVRIELGLEDAERAEVLSGLSEGDEVVITGQAGLSDGGKIARVDASGEPVGDDAPGQQDAAEAP